MTNGGILQLDLCHAAFVPQQGKKQTFHFKIYKAYSYGTLMSTGWKNNTVKRWLGAMEHDFSRKDNREAQRDKANPYPNSTCTCLVVALVVFFLPCPSRPFLKPSAETACLAASAFTLQNYFCGFSFCCTADPEIN